MDPKRIQDLFLQAVESCPPAEWDRFLDETCPDPESRRRVEKLLRAHARQNPLLDRGDEVRPGQQIGHYEVIEELGEGGFGIVYRARQQEPLERDVALKIIKPGMDTRQVVARFRSEQQVLARMDHPNIARVLDAGATEQGRPYFVMELIRGVPITQFCDDRRMTVDGRLGLFRQVCAAVQHAHQKGIIHRDLKPSNVLIVMQEDTPVPKVIDFGIAKALDSPAADKTEFTRSGQLLGTYEYMSPEQASLQPIDIDTRSDIYSLGVLLYQLLSGDTPFGSAQLRSAAFDEQLRILREQDAPRLSLRLSTSKNLAQVADLRQTDPAHLKHLVSRDLDWIVTKTLEKDRERRYQSANELGEEVERFLANEPVTAGPPSTLYRMRKWIKRNKAAFTAGTSLLLLLILGVIGTSIGFLRANEAAESARRQLYASDMRAAGLALAEGVLPFVEQRLEDYERSDLRRWEWHYLKTRMQRHEVARQIPIPVGSYMLDVSADGRMAAVSHAEQAVCTLVDLTTGETETLGESRKYDFIPTFVAFSPDGRKIAYPANDLRGIVVRDIMTGETMSLHESPGDRITRVAFSPDGRSLAVDSDRRGLMILDGQSGEALHKLMEGQVTDNRLALAYSPEGSLLAAATSSGSLKLFSFDAEVASSKEIIGDGELIFDTAFSPSGAYLVAARKDGTVVVCDTRSNTILSTLHPSGDEVRSVAFSPDGTLIAAGSRDRKVTIWRFPSLDLFDELPGYNELYGIKFSPDGTLVFPGQNCRLLLYPRDSLGEQRPVTTEAWISSLSFSTDGRQLFAASGGRVHHWRVTDRTLVEQDAIETGFPVNCVAASSKNLLAAGASDGLRVEVMQLGDRQEKGDVVHVDSDTWTNCLSFSGSGDLLAIGAEDGTVAVWDVGKRALKWRSQEHTRRVSQLAFSADGSRLLSGSWDAHAILWDTVRGNVIRDLGDQSRPVISVSLNGKGNRACLGLFSGSTPAQTEGNSRVVLWDLETMTPHYLPSSASDVPGVALLRDEQTIVTCGADQTLRLIDIATERERLTVQQRQHIFARLAVSPDERILAAGCRDGSIFLYRRNNLPDE